MLKVESLPMTNLAVSTPEQTPRWRNERAASPEVEPRCLDIKSALCLSSIQLIVCDVMVAADLQVQII